MEHDSLSAVVAKISVQGEQNAQDIKEITTALKGISEKLDTKTSTNWGVIWSSLGVVAVLVAGAWALVNTQITASKEQAAMYIRADESRKQLIENIVIGDIRERARRYDDLVYARLGATP
jgi:hypothetical protein